jgi:hypothetical protein
MLLAKWNYLALEAAASVGDCLRAFYAATDCLHPYDQRQAIPPEMKHLIQELRSLMWPILVLSAYFLLGLWGGLR